MNKAQVRLTGINLQRGGNSVPGGEQRDAYSIQLEPLHEEGSMIARNSGAFSLSAVNVDGLKLGEVYTLTLGAK